jgi:hypothetical protein
MRVVCESYVPRDVLFQHVGFEASASHGSTSPAFFPVQFQMLIEQCNVHMVYRSWELRFRKDTKETCDQWENPLWPISKLRTWIIFITMHKIWPSVDRRKEK